MIRCRLGSLFRCSVCGSEVTVVSYKGGEPSPMCCNKPMEATSCISKIFYCSVCGSEVALIKETAGKIEPFCCNKLMVLKK